MISTVLSQETLVNAALLEKRVAALEHAVEDLKHWRNTGGPAADWIDRLTGSISDEATFRKALKAGRAFRQASRPAERGDEQ
ncbi:MAG TPA: hypothetical protein VML55_23285 [Planctomycetaceae bacterium]|nr:hypothetical protein [Planctomycetaceae bacterium]